jgi:hypothetical protein
MANEPIMCVRITGPVESVRKLIARHKLLLEGARQDGKNVSGETFIPNSAARKLKGEGVEVNVLYDASRVGKERQKEVMNDNPFLDGSIPQGLGKKVKGDRDVS